MKERPYLESVFATKTITPLMAKHLLRDSQTQPNSTAVLRFYGPKQEITTLLKFN